MSLEEAYKNNTLISIEDNLEYNRLKKATQLWGLLRYRTYFKIEFIDLVRDTTDDKEYLLYRSEEPINGIVEHGVEFTETTLNDVYDYDKGNIDKVRNDFTNINRLAIDYKYSGLEDFLEQYNKLKEEHPERMI